MIISLLDAGPSQDQSSDEESECDFGGFEAEKDFFENDFEGFEATESNDFEGFESGLSPKELPLLQMIREEAEVKSRSQEQPSQEMFNLSDLLDGLETSSEYDLLPAPVTDVRDLPINEFFSDENHDSLTYWIQVSSIIPIDIWPLINGKNASILTITLAMIWGWIYGK